MRVRDGVWRFGTEYVSFYAVEEDGRVTVVDCGLPAYWDRFIAGLSEMGKSLDDVDAVVLTHGDADHIGIAEKIRTEAKVPVFIHEDDVQGAKGQQKLKAFKPTLSPYQLKLGFHMVRSGVTKTPWLKEATTFQADEVIDVPGKPRAIHTPGHTPGHCGLLFESVDSIFVGDSLVTRNLKNGREGPIMMPSGFHKDPDAAFAALSAYDGVDAAYVLPGHGEPWREGLGQALRHTRDAGFP